MVTATLRLYETVNALQTVETWLLEAGGELTPEIEALLAEAEGDFATKAERVALKVRELQATAAGIKIEAQRLAAMEKAVARSAESLKTYLYDQMQQAGKTEVKGVLVKLAIQNSPPSAKWTFAPEDLRLLPDEYVTVVPESRQLNARAAIDAWKAGQPLPIGLTVEQGTHLRIR